MIKQALALTVAAALLVGCQTTSGTKETFGTIGGAVAGGLLGAQLGKGDGQLVATGVGTLLGAFIGNQIGASLDKADQQYATAAEQQAHTAPVGETIAWNNPRSGNSGEITPVRDGYTTTGSYCREYQQTITVGGRVETAYGTACRQEDGTWRIVN